MPTETARTAPGRSRPADSEDASRAAFRRNVLRWGQVPLVAVLLWALDAADRFRGGARTAGLAHAVAVASISRVLGGAIAGPMNDWLAVHATIAVAAAAYYIVIHGLVTGVAGLALIWRRVPSFPLHRNALIAATAIALVVFWFYPVAPPRMLAGYHDVTASSSPFFASLLNGHAADQFASLPSLHITWALWVAVAVQAVLRRPALRAAVWIYPAATTLDVLVTANHYMLDVVAAPGVLLLAYAVAALTLAPGRKLLGGASASRPSDGQAGW